MRSASLTTGSVES